MASYAGFGPTGVFDVVTAAEDGTSMVFAAELADGYDDPLTEVTQLSAPECVDRLWEGMLKHERPLGMVAGAAGRDWEHVTAVARGLIERSTGKQMMFDDGPEWMGAIIECSPASTKLAAAKTFVRSLDGESERLVLVLWARGDAVTARKWIKGLFPPIPSKTPPPELVLEQACVQCEAKPGEPCVKPDGAISFRPHKPRIRAVGYEPLPRAPLPALMVLFFDGECDRSQIMSCYRLLERRELLRGRGVLLVDPRRPLFS